MKNSSFRIWKVPLALLLFFILLCAGTDGHAAVKYTVRKGDTLSGIAHRYNVSVRALRQLNRVKATHLRPGSGILIPEKNKTVEKRAVKAVEKGEAVSNETAETRQSGIGSFEPASHGASDLYHTVRKGETLSSIARKYAVRIDDIKDLNGLGTSRIKTGLKLLIRLAGPRFYIVRKGDSLEKIARRYDMDPADLMEINEMETPVVRVGQKLYLQETVEETSGEVAQTDADTAPVPASHGEKADEEPAQGRLVAFARKLLNIPYKFGGNSILGIDCSAYVKKVYGLLGIDLPRTAREQFNSGEPIDRDQLSVGDLVFFRTYASFPSHVGIYIGNNLFIHASSKGRKVTISNLDTPYFLKRFIGAKRLLTGQFMDGLSDEADSGTPDKGVH